MEKQTKEKRKYTCVSYPKDQVDKVRKVIQYQLSGAANVSEYFKIHMDEKIRLDYLRVQSHLYDLEQLQKEKEEREN